MPHTASEKTAKKYASDGVGRETESVGKEDERFTLLRSSQQEEDQEKDYRCTDLRTVVDC